MSEASVTERIMQMVTKGPIVKLPLALEVAAGTELAASDTELAAAARFSDAACTIGPAFDSSSA